MGVDCLEGRADLLEDHRSLFHIERLLLDVIGKCAERTEFEYQSAVLVRPVDQLDDVRVGAESTECVRLSIERLAISGHLDRNGVGGNGFACFCFPRVVTEQRCLKDNAVAARAQKLADSQACIINMGSILHIMKDIEKHQRGQV